MGKTKNGYTVTNSNYTLKEFHQNAPNGEIYERDFMSTSNLSGWDGGVFPVSENGFKMVFRDTFAKTRAHNFGSYIQCISGEHSYDDWTLQRCATKTSSTTEGEIKLNNDDTTLLSYAYYGSCTELIHSTIEHIIKNFPAEVYANGERDTLITTHVDDCQYILHNPFGIDFMTENVTDTRDVNELRYFTLTYTRYKMKWDVIDCGCGTSFTITKNPDFCSIKENGTWDAKIEIHAGTQSVKIIRHFINGQPYYLTNCGLYLSLRPCAEDIEAYFASIDDFENVLLNRDSHPIYSATLDFPHETKNGIESYKKKFTWPLDDGGWNLDITSVLYENYVNSLLELSEFYDEYRTDNLWRMMTHEAIKNMDLTFSRPGTDEGKEDYNEGTTRLRGLLWAYGRLFDDLKRYIDNIRKTNTITYNGQGNLPDYFLTDTLGLSGWEISNALNGLDKSTVWTDSSNTENSVDYTISDANVRFMNNLKINSKAILSRKGTRYGIEMILGLFGLVKDTDYDITEYVTTAEIKAPSGITTHCKAGTEELLSVETVNRYKTTIDTDSPDGVEINTLEGLPVSLFYYTRYMYTEVQAAGSDTIEDKDAIPSTVKATDPKYIRVNNKIYRKDEETWKTTIPWYDPSQTYDGNLYFQMFGGWGLISSRYKETLNYLKVARTLNDLTLFPKETIIKNFSEKQNFIGDICYVAEITQAEFERYYPHSPYDATWSHYFKLTNPENVGVIGENDEGTCEGWTPINITNESWYVTYLESIIEEYRGNNPHVGFGNYDEGEGYFEYIKQIFKGAIDSDSFRDEMYTCSNGELSTGVTSQGFNILNPRAVDNQKCWYFYDKDKYNLEDQNLQKLTLQTDGYNYNGEPMNYVDGPTFGMPDVRGEYGGDISYVNNEKTIYQEPSAINRKNLQITFKLNTNFSSDETNYIKNTVMPYLEQMIPSTTILKISFENQS